MSPPHVAPRHRALRRRSLLPPFVTFPAGLLLLALIPGCAVFGGGTHREGGSSLTEAAEESAKAPEKKQKRLEAGEQVPNAPAVEVTVGGESYAPEGRARPHEHQSLLPETNSRYKKLHVGAVAGGGFLSGENFGGFGAGGVQVGFNPGERWRVDANVLSMKPNFSHTSGLERSFRNQDAFALDVSARYYLTPEHTTIGVYPLTGFRVGLLRWHYANPLSVVENGETRTVAADDLVFYAPYVGIGTSLLQTRYVHVGGQLITGAQMFGRYTHEGFRNDLFKLGSFSQAQLELTFMF